MPLICIGPVCIPISALLPVLAYLARPVWKRLPEPTQQLLIGYWQAFSEWMQANLWDRVGWKAKPAPAAKGATAEMAAGAGDLASIADELRSRTGSVAGLHSLDDWAAAKLVSASMPVIVDFTAAWCGPCQKIKPFFAELAAAHEEALFVTVDVDELEQVSEEAQVRAMPTFQVRVAPQGRLRRLPQFLSLPPAAARSRFHRGTAILKECSGPPEHHPLDSGVELVLTGSAYCAAPLRIGRERLRRSRSDGSPLPPPRAGVQGWCAGGDGHGCADGGHQSNGGQGSASLDRLDPQVLYTFGHNGGPHASFAASPHR